ncbi:dihydrofolate reductase [Candidatus Saccharibacteria bacterium]|nr:dihydrofolate reductase [Candidatus Saccharibacteria bacterium]
MVRFIAALDSKNGIADDHGIPWQGKIPTDVQQFRAKTEGGAVMMGYGWYVEQQQPLPSRRNLVATSKPEKLREGFELVTDARQFLQQTQDDIWVGGGAGLFASTLDLADELYLTRLDKDFNCTKFFPKFEDTFMLQSQSQPITENGITYTFQVWVKK